MVPVSFAAVVAREDHHGVAFEPCTAQCLQHTANTGVHTFHHGGVNLQRTASDHRPFAMVGVSDGLILGSLPRRMRGGVVEAEIKRPGPAAGDERCRSVRQQVRQVSDALDRFEVFPEIGPLQSRWIDA